MKIEIPDLTGAECGDIAVTAAEGGIGYWAVIDAYDYRRWSPDAAQDNLEVTDDFVFYRIAFESPVETGVGYADITPALIRRGFERGLAAPRDMGGWFVHDLLAKAREDWTGEIDSDGADLIIQFGVFGEVVFG